MGMHKLTNDQQRRLIHLRLSDKYEKAFLSKRENAYKLKDLWSELSAEMVLDGKGEMLKNEYNDLLKQFRQKN